MQIPCAGVAHCTSLILEVVTNDVTLSGGEVTWEGELHHFGEKFALHEKARFRVAGDARSLVDQTYEMPAASEARNSSGLRRSRSFELR